MSLSAEQRRAIVAACDSESGLLCAYLFGSEASGTAGALSDVDVAILLDSRLGARNRLEIVARIGERISTQTGRRADVVDLREAGPELIDRVVRFGAVLVDRDPRARVNYEARSLDEYLDFLPVLDAYDRILLQRAREGRLGA